MILINKKNFSCLLVTLIISLNLLYSIIPNISYGVLLGLIVLFFVLNIKELYSISRGKNWLFALAVWFFLAGAITIATNNIRFFKVYVFGLLNLLFPFVAYLFFRKDKKSIRFINVTSIVTLIICNFVFMIIRDSSVLYSYRSESSYILTYTNALFALVLLYRFLKKDLFKTHFRNIVRILLVVFFSALVILSGFFLAIIALFFGVLLTIVYAFCRSKDSFFLITAFVVVFFFVVARYGDSIIEWVIGVVNNENYIQRLDEVRGNIYGGANFGDYFARQKTYLLSWNSFINYPLFGKIWYLDDSVLFYEAIGYHSTVLDNLALFGVFGFIPTLLIFYPLFYWGLIKKHRLYKMVGIVFSFALILMLNNQVAPIGYVVYFYLVSENLGAFKRKEISSEKNLNYAS